MGCCRFGCYGVPPNKIKGREYLFIYMEDMILANSLSMMLEAKSRTLVFTSGEESLVDLYPHSFTQPNIAAGARVRSYIEGINNFYLSTILRPKKRADDLKLGKGIQQGCHKTGEIPS